MAEQRATTLTGSGSSTGQWSKAIEDYKQKRAEAKGRAKLGHALHMLWLTIAGAVVALFTWFVSGGKPHP